MKASEINDRLEKLSIRPTPVRIAVFKFLFSSKRPCSHQEILANSEVAQFNRVTVYRTLDLFLSSNILHRVQGADGVWRFCTNHSSDSTECSGNHVHFSCLECSQVFCLPEIKLPWVETPKGHEIYSKQLVVYGKCKDCIKKSKNIKKK